MLVRMQTNGHSHLEIVWIGSTVLGSNLIISVKAEDYTNPITPCFSNIFISQSRLRNTFYVASHHIHMHSTHWYFKISSVELICDPLYWFHGGLLGCNLRAEKLYSLDPLQHVRSCTIVCNVEKLWVTLRSLKKSMDKL